MKKIKACINPNRVFGLLALIYSLVPNLICQSPYEVNLKQEISYISVGVGTVGLGGYLSSLAPVLSNDELQILNVDDINTFDRYATNRYSFTAKSWSDVLGFGSFIAPALLLTDRRTKTHFGQIMAMYGEAAFINAGLTILTKSIVHRPRPFVYNQDVPQELKLTKDAKASFLSGHASMTALNTFFIAKVYNDFFPNNKLKPVIWGIAASIPALTGYLRIDAGKHFPTDVIAGYALGATIGILIPQLHKKRGQKQGQIDLNIGLSSARLMWKFTQ